MGAVKLLLDTHVLVWRATEPDRIGPSARAAISDLGNELFVSSVSAWELATKHRLGKLPSGDVIVAGFAAQLRVLGAQELSVNVEHALLAGGLAVDHRDPFDRMLAAQALVEGAALVTSDRAFGAFPITTLW